MQAPLSCDCPGPTCTVRALVLTYTVRRVRPSLLVPASYLVLARRLRAARITATALSLSADTKRACADAHQLACGLVDFCMRHPRAQSGAAVTDALSTIQTWVASIHRAFCEAHASGDILGPALELLASSGARVSVASAAASTRPAPTGLPIGGGGGAVRRPRTRGRPLDRLPR